VTTEVIEAWSEGREQMKFNLGVSPANRRLKRPSWALPHLIALASPLVLSTSGCSSLFDEGAAAAAGVGGAAVAGGITRNAAVAAGIGLGVLAAAQEGVKAVKRNYHGDQQDEIAEIAGDLAVGQVAQWQSRHTIKLESDEAGKVTVSRIISATDLNCKEVVFSVDHVEDAATLSSFYVATICRDAVRWRWATAEPATARWGNLR
jgi:hypothetical protein